MPQSGGVKILMMCAKDGVDGVTVSHSSFMPSDDVVKYVADTVGSRNRRLEPWCRHASKICDSLKLCATHNY
jgi:hypothetical protein